MDATDTPAIARFITVAQEFMTWVDGSTELTPQDMLALHWLMARLQVAIIELPTVTSEDQLVAAQRNPSAHHDRFVSLIERFERIDFNRYLTILFPLDDDREPVDGSLADDVAGIYYDLETGLAYARVAKFLDAVWEWRFGYFNHWGYHLADAQAALRQYLQLNAAPWFDPPR